MMPPRTLALVGVLVFCSGFALAQDDVEGSKDHPMFTRMPGYAITDYDAQDFANFELALEPPKTVEGRYWKIDYGIKEGAKKIGPLQIARNHTDLLVKRGGKKVMEDVSPSGGTTVTQLASPSGSLWLQIEISNEGEAFSLIVVDEAKMEQKVEFTSAELASALNSKGAVALHDILFETGKATLQPASAAVLAPIGELLKSDQTLKLEIQGHTDNVGVAAGNLKLSQDRAAAVKAHLVQTFGIDAGRLTTRGLGDAVPVGDNRTDAGRAQNRRVELVKK